ncbi:MAG: ATP-dependent 6-phosphofructokinase [candidate division KSB1 bacterium]|jgi:6-phosphofructokinase 1|nr:ATP-dependent 6-phosphofructokinase [candidate division KSB1 bacterium]
MKTKIKRIGVLTGGGDCPGLNAVIRAVTKTAINDYDIEVVGFKDGFQGLVENTYVNLTSSYVSGILTMGGTILGTNNRIDPFRFPMLEGGKTRFLDRSEEALRNVERLGLEVVVCIGGDGTMAVSKKMEEKGLKVVGVPKTIDNDLFGTDVTFGFDSAMTTATEAIDKLHSTAQSHHRVMIVEVMGRYAGWLALYSGIAGGGDIILIPEIPFSIDSIVETIKERRYDGKYFSILIVGEGAKPAGGEMVVQRRIEDSPEAVRLGGIGNKVGEMIEQVSGVETRVTTLGHLVRGGIPTPNDRLLATRFGVEAMRLVVKGEYGKMVALQGDKIGSIPVEEVGGKCRTVPLDSPIIAAARSVGTCLGE